MLVAAAIRIEAPRPKRRGEMRRLWFGLVLLSVAALATFGVTAWALRTSWTTAVIDRGYVNGLSAVMDEGGALHVAYTGWSSQSGDFLRYLTNAGGHWSVTPVNQTDLPLGGGFWSPSMGVDSEGRVHIAYVLDNWSYRPSLWYATESGDGWTTSIVDSSAILPSLAIDPQDGVHISCLHRESGYVQDSLRYLTYTGGSWNESQVYYLGSNLLFAHQLAINAEGTPYLGLMFDTPLGGAGYAVRANDTWQFHSINNSTRLGYESYSFAVDSRGALHMTYFNVSETSGHPYLEYATNATGLWSFTRAADLAYRADLADYVPYGVTSMIIDSSGHIHVVYTDDLASELRYATNASGSWSSVTIGHVRTGFFSHQPMAIAARSVDRVHILYVDYDFSGNPLFYATNAVDSTNVDAYAAKIRPLLSDEALILGSIGGPLLVLPQARSGISGWLDRRRAEEAARKAKYEEIRRALR